MRINEEDGSIDITKEEAVKLEAIGFTLVYNSDGKVIAVVEKKNTEA